MDNSTENGNRKSKSAGHGILIAGYATIFVLAFSVFYVPSIVEATHCGKSKNTVTGSNTESGDKWGNRGTLAPFAATICGDSYANEGSYIHNVIADITENIGFDYVETGWFKGRTASEQSTGSDLHYVMIKKNAYGGGYSFTDLTSATGYKPVIGDSLNVQQNWDHYTNFKDYYRIEIQNIGKHTIVVENVHVNGRGTLALTQGESQNTGNVMKGESVILKDMNTSSSWSSWSSSTGSKEPNSPSNPFCYVKVAADSYKFGKLVSGSCSTS